MKQIKCVVDIGHSEKSPGAVNIVHETTEFGFNKKLALAIAKSVNPAFCSVELVYRDTYRNLPDKINALNPDFVVSLHCNAFNRAASGSEAFFYRGSSRGMRLAELLQSHIKNALGLHDRGIKPRSADDRGGYQLRYVHAPIVICEPFFIDNDYDLRIANSRYHLLVDAYARAIEQYAKHLQA